MSARAEEIKRAGLNASLPSYFRYGDDAMDLVNIGKRIATEAILALPPEGGETDAKGKEGGLSLINAFDLGYDWAHDLQNPQTLEDSRAVGRTLLSDRFKLLKLDIGDFNSFQSADLGICAAKKIIHAALASRPTVPEATPEGGEEAVVQDMVCRGDAWRNLVAEREEQLRQVQSTLAARDAEIAALTTANKQIFELAEASYLIRQQLSAEIAALKADKARMGEALEPFAAMGRVIDMRASLTFGKKIPDAEVMCKSDGEVGLGVLTMGHFRDAEALMPDAPGWGGTYRPIGVRPRSPMKEPS